MTQSQSFPEIILELAARKETGLLEILASEIRTKIYVQTGAPCFAEGGSLEDTLGRILVREKKLTDEQYENALAQMKAGLVQNQQVRLGEVLIQLGYLRPEEVFESLKIQVRYKILACFQWESFTHSFQSGADKLTGIIPVDTMAVEPLVLDGIKRHYDPARLEAILSAKLEDAATLRVDPHEIAQRFGLNGREQRFLVELSSKKTIRGLRDGSNLDSIHASQLMVALLFGKVMQTGAPSTYPTSAPAHRFERVAPPRTAPPRSDPPRTAPPRSDSPRTAPPRSAPPQTAAAPIATPQRPGIRPPTKVATPVRAVPRPGAATIAPAAPVPAAPVTPTKAATVPPAGAAKKPAEKSPVYEKRAKLEADEAFQSGKRFLKQNLLGGALKDFQKAVQLQPNESEYDMFCGWAEYMLAKDEETRKKARNRTHQAATKLLSQNRTHAAAFRFLGHLIKQSGEFEKAKRYFELAVENAPTDYESQMELRLLSKRIVKVKKKEF